MLWVGRNWWTSVSYFEKLIFQGISQLRNEKLHRERVCGKGRKSSQEPAQEGWFTQLSPITTQEWQLCNRPLCSFDFLSLEVIMGHNSCLPITLSCPLLCGLPTLILLLASLQRNNGPLRRKMQSVCTAFPYWRTEKPLQAFHSINKQVQVWRREVENPFCPQFLHMEPGCGLQCQEDSIHSSTSGNQCCFLFILFGKEAGCKYENSAIDFTSAQWSPFMSSEVGAKWGRKRQMRYRFSPKGICKPQGETASLTPRYSLKAVCGVLVTSTKTHSP